MSLTFLEKPNTVDFVKNGLRYKIQTDYIITPGQKAKFYFKKIGTLSVWDGFNVPIPGTVSEYITAPAIATTEEDTIGWLNAIRYNVDIDETISDLKRVYLFDKHYDIYKDLTDKIVFEARISGEIDPTLIVFNNTTTPASYEFINPTYVDNVGVDAEYWDKMVIGVKMYYGGNEVCELNLNVDEEGITEIEAGKFLNTDVIDKGSVAYSLFRITTSMDFKIGFSQAYYGIGSNYPYVFDEVDTLPGKVPFNEHPDFDFEEAVFFNSLKKIDTYAEAFHKLTFYSGHCVLTHTEFSIDIFYTDGTNEQVVIDSVIQYGNTLYNYSFFISDLIAEGDSEKDIYKISVYTDIGTDKVWFWIKDISFLDKQFLFKNTFGFWEVINCKGNKTETTKIERETFKKHISAGYSSDEGEYTSDVLNSHPEFEVETGSKEKQEVAQITEALRSKEFYEIIDAEYIKCELMNSDVEILNEAEDLQNIIIKYRHSFDD